MKNTSTGAPSECNLGESAVIICSGELEGFSGRALLARTISNTPANEARFRGTA